MDRHSAYPQSCHEGPIGGVPGQKTLHTWGPEQESGRQSIVDNLVHSSLPPPTSLFHNYQIPGKKISNKYATFDYYIQQWIYLLFNIDQRAMTIATYNVNGVNGHLNVLLRWLQQSAPDVVCLQELKAPQEKFPEEAIRDAGYQAIWHGQKSWNGVAILARGKNIQERCRVLPGDPEDIQSRYIEATVDDLTIGCLYLPNGNPFPGPKFEYKLGWIERFKLHAADLLHAGNPVVLTGDFNIIPTEVDVYKPERWTKDALFQPEVRQAFRAFTDGGWTDALRTLYPDEVIYTYWDYFRNAYGRNAGLRIDHFLLNAAAAQRLSAAGVNKEVRGWEKTSDHAPVWIELKAE